MIPSEALIRIETVGWFPQSESIESKITVKSRLYVFQRERGKIRISI